MSRTSPTAPREVALFRNNRSQAVRIPREFELPGEKALIRKEHGRLIMEPVKPSGLVELLDGWGPIAEELPAIDDPPPEPSTWARATRPRDPAARHHHRAHSGA